MPKKYKYPALKNPYLSLLESLKKPQNYQHFLRALGLCDGYCCGEEELRLLSLMGAPLEYDSTSIVLKTSTNSIDEQCFCFVDVEANGSNPMKNQVIEIGALLYQHGKIIDTFESFVFCEHIPHNISELTQISLDDVVHAPVLSVVMKDFRVFLGDALFVAHNMDFDFNFLNAMFVRCGLGWLCNRRLCTIQLAQKIISTTHYNLGALSALLGIDTPVLHRAYADALSALRIFEYCLLRLPPQIRTAEELISFSSHQRTGGYSSLSH